MQLQRARNIPYYGGLALLVYMPFHIFLSQWLSTFTGGLNVWKVAKDVVTAMLVLATIGVVWASKRRTRVFDLAVGFMVLYALLHVVLWAAHPSIYRPSAILGVTYNVRIFCYLVIGLGAYLLTPEKLAPQKLMKLSLGLGVVVAALGILQYFLPGDLLTHFGYSAARGVLPSFFIDNNPAFPRATSTLRDPNTLGAFLLVPMSIALLFGLRARDVRRRLLLAAAFAVQLLALVFTESRSAWLAAIVTFALVLWWQYRTQFARVIRRWWPLLIALVLLAGVGAYAGRHSHFVKGYIVHSTGKPKAAHDSDGFHILFVEQGLKGIAHNPLGHGPGTAGLASIQNPKGSFLTENYYVQLGYEIGVLGVGLFIAAQAFIYMKLRRANEPLKIVLLASFWGYVLCNMLLHMWSGEAVACQWWLLAGVGLAEVSDTSKTASKSTTVSLGK